jgi:hypothetical protein
MYVTNFDRGMQDKRTAHEAKHLLTSSKQLRKTCFFRAHMYSTLRG